MEHFPATLSRGESETLIARSEECFERLGFGLWALQLRGEGSMAGFVGLNPVPDEMPFSPAVEIGWRLARSHWSRGFATEAARAAVDFGFERIGLDELVSFTTTTNSRSRAVMERLGMSRDPAEDFVHPTLPVDSPQSPHVLYRLRRA